MPPPISIIIPALNEAESISHVVAEMPWHLLAECIVVDNGSTDATASIAAQAGARVITAPRGYGAACLAGSNAALPSSTILVYMDGDGSDVIAASRASLRRSRTTKPTSSSAPAIAAPANPAPCSLPRYSPAVW
jgi:glycosyltransferase involved in cell wall biosynthesis